MTLTEELRYATQEIISGCGDDEIADIVERAAKELNRVPSIYIFFYPDKHDILFWTKSKEEADDYAEFLERSPEVFWSMK